MTERWIGRFFKKGHGGVIILHLIQPKDTLLGDEYIGKLMKTHSGPLSCSVKCCTYNESRQSGRKVIGLIFASPLFSAVDKVVNNYGLKLLEICKILGIHIVNGRFVSDSVGNMTYVSHSGCSVVDYFII